MGDSKGRTAGDRMRILVVDDEPSICNVLKIALELEGHDVVTAQSGDNALSVLSAGKIDVLVIDLRIPDTRGDVVFELAAAWHPHLRHQTLFMTGDISERAHKLILSCKCPSIRKPFELRQLVGAVAKLTPRRARGSRGHSA